MINVLSQETVNKIAAGEVVERPESVVKELLENAIDSGAKNISTEIREGGLSLIRVTDDGSGIEKDDIPLAFLRHATSKLREASDLFAIDTMGFRGEALASICGVSEAEMITKRENDMFGYRYRIEGGVPRGLEEIGAPDGTTVIVRNLFYNVPARKKFLKSKMTEAAHIADIVEKTALSHPDIAFRLASDGKNLLHTAGDGKLKNVIYTIYGREISENLIKIDRAEQGLLVTGYVGKPVIARSKRDFEICYVNGRYIKSAVIGRAVEDAFKPFMMLHKFPFALVHLSVDPKQVDVNVHPKKTEVRFSDNERIYHAVFSAISDALYHEELIVQAAPGAEKAARPSFGVGSLPVEKERRAEPFEKKKDAAFEKKVSPETGEKAGERGRFPQHGTENGRKAGVEILEELFSKKAAPAGFVSDSSCEASSCRARGLSDAPRETERYGAGGKSGRENPGFPKDSAAETEKGAVQNSGTGAKAKAESPFATPEKGSYAQETLFSERFLSEASVPHFKLIGQAFETYWLIEFSDKLYIIDQHAAHEKVNYERMMRSLKEKTPQSQMLALPMQLSLSVGEAELLRKHLSAFEEFGYEIEENGERDFLVRAVPADLYSAPEKELFLELLDSLSEDRSRADTPDSLRHKIATMSCKAAVKGNNYLSEPEMKALIGELLTLENPYACPHGRPTIISMSKYELDRKFKRIVS